MANPREILRTLQANARKSLSQNFLTSPHWADTLTRVTLEPDADEIWEIGPGLGALTSQLLAKTSKPVRAFEYDRKLSVYLRETLVPAHANFELIEGDAMDVDFRLYRPEVRRISLLSNLPYHLSSPLLFKFLEARDRFLRFVLTFQKEFADRLIAVPDTSEYGALSVLIQLHFQIDTIGVLPAGAFYPPPTIASEALMLTPKPSPSHGSAHISRVVKAAFAHRRKRALRNLREVFPTTPWEAAFEKLALDPNVRAEVLSKEQFVALTGEVRSYICEAICRS